jgi:hypothetical protein
MAKMKHDFTSIFDWHGIKHHEFIPDHIMVNKERYNEVLSLVWKAVHLESPKLWAAKRLGVPCMALPPAHHSLFVQQHIKHATVVLPNPLYSLSHFMVGKAKVVHGAY